MDITRMKLFLASLLSQIITAQEKSVWDDWWSYEGISGPDYWGLLNVEWALCSKGKNQSPINIDPKTLLFDPSLGPLVIEGERISGYLHNTGHDITFKVSKKSLHRVFITEGPLSYRYRVKQIRAHFHTQDDLGSEHTVDRKSFPVELQILAYNTDLYSNISIAERSPRGLVAIALFVQISENPNSELDVFTKAANKTKYKGDITRIQGLHLSRLLPAVDNYITYEGSVTYPGCFETVTWIVLNKPLHASKSQIESFRRLNLATRKNPQMLMAPNIRPLMPLNQRTVRTNINFRSKSCSMLREMFYTVNEKFKEP